MSNKVELLKTIIKGDSEISEDAALDKYLLSRGINPKFATKDQKVSHSKTTEFITWKNYHMNEAVDKKDTVTFDIPLLIRVMELAREELKSDMDLHRVVEKLINIRNKGMLTMKDYNYIAKIHEEVMPHVSLQFIEEGANRHLKNAEKYKKSGDMLNFHKHMEKHHGTLAANSFIKNNHQETSEFHKHNDTAMKHYRSYLKLASKQEDVSENHIAIAMGKMLDDEGSMVLNQLDDIDRCSKMIREYIGKDYEKQLPAWVQSKVTLAADYINTVGTYLMSKNEEVESIDEISTDGYHKAAIKSRQDAAVKLMSSMGQDKAARTKLDARNRGLNRLSDRTSAEMKKANSGPQRQPVGKEPTEAERRGYGQGRYMGDSVEHDNATMVEAQSAAVRFQKALENAKKKREEEERRNAENAKRALTPKPVQEADCSCDDVPPEDKNKKLIQMSKSARMIKSIYKKKGMKEDMYDYEKDDKSVSSYGKKPKMSATSKESSFGEKKPDAAAVLTGGTTLTGQPRDTIEIDPMMRKRPGPDVPGKKN
jgi:hypothetical protein